MDQNELRHYGVLGMKWGVRRDKLLRKMRLRKARKKREAAKKKEEAKAARQEKAANAVTKSAAKKSQRELISEMSDEQIRKAIDRIRMEKELAELISTPKAKSGASKAGGVLAKAGSELLISASKKAGPILAEHYLAKYGIVGSKEKKKKDDD